MSILDEIFHEYQRMRQNGLETKEALRALRAYIEALDQNDKQLLADHLRSWEKKFQAHLAEQAQQQAPQQQAPPPPPEEQMPSAPRPSPSVRKIQPRPIQQEAPQPQAETWVECTNCGRKNRVADVFCYACGHILESASTQHDTKLFSSATDELYNDSYYGPDSVILLQVRDSGMQFELRPQYVNHETMIGRGAGSNAMAPDVDLDQTGGAEYGVSRLHASIRYSQHEETIEIADLGSSNGTFVNGQRLQPHELRSLRNGDEIRFGRLITRIIFQHPGQQI